MNFLGHCVFSEDNPSALAGSLWPDFALRPAESNCSQTFLTHFDRHQAIDRFTDQHILLKPLREALRPIFRKTTPIIVDMLLDHYLANHWSDIHQQPLETFSRQTYQHLHNFNELALPERMARTVFWMSQQDWFVGYRSEAGIKRALSGMAKRIRFQNPIEANQEQALEVYRDFRSDMNDFIHTLSSDITTGQI